MRHPLQLPVVLLLAAGWFPAWARASEPVLLEVAAGEHERCDVPVVFPLTGALGDCACPALVRLDSGERVPVQVEEQSAGRRLVWILGDALPAGSSRRYRLLPEGGEAADVGNAPGEGGVRVDDDGKRLLVKVAGKPVLAYHQAVVPSPYPKEPYYARSGHIHPVYNPSGQVMTDDFSPDHAHQHGIMFAWTKSTFEGRPANCWDQKSGKGTVEHVKVERVDEGPVFGRLVVRLRHVNLNGPKGRVPMLDETWQVRVYRLTDHFLFDLESRQTCAGKSALVVEEYHYGGLMIRGNRGWHGPENGDFLTSQGKTRANGNHTRPRWCDIFGPIDGRVSGVTILGHPANFGFPQPVRLHPSMPYFCFAPAVLGSFAIEPGGKPYVSSYRFYVHDGKLDPARADRIWHDLADPPRVRMVED